MSENGNIKIYCRVRPSRKVSRGCLLCADLVVEKTCSMLAALATHRLLPSPSSPLLLCCSVVSILQPSGFFSIGPERQLLEFDIPQRPDTEMMHHAKTKWVQEGGKEGFVG